MGMGLGQLKFRKGLKQGWKRSAAQLVVSFMIVLLLVQTSARQGFGTLHRSTNVRPEQGLSGGFSSWSTAGEDHAAVPGQFLEAMREKAREDGFSDAPIESLPEVRGDGKVTSENAVVPKSAHEEKKAELPRGAAPVNTGDKIVPARQAAGGVKPVQVTQDTKAAEVAADPKPVAEAQVTGDAKVAGDSKPVEETQVTEEVKVAVDSKPIEQTQVIEEAAVAGASKPVVELVTAQVKVPGESKPVNAKPVVEEVKVAEESKLVDATQMTEEVRVAEESKPVDTTQVTEEVSVAEESKPVDEKQVTEEVMVPGESTPADEKQVTEKVRVAEESKPVDEKQVTEEVRVPGESTPADEKQVTEEKVTEESKLVDEKQVNEEVKVAEESKLVNEKQANEEVKVAEESKLVDEKQTNEEVKVAEESKLVDEKQANEESNLPEEPKLVDEKQANEESNLPEESKLVDEKHGPEEAKLSGDSEAAEKTQVTEQAALDGESKKGEAAPIVDENSQQEVATIRQPLSAFDPIEQLPVEWPDREVLNRVANFEANKTGVPRIIVSAVSCNFLDMANNWLSSLESAGVFNYLIVALDDGAYDRLKAVRPDHVVASPFTAVSQNATYGSEGFAKVVRSRPVLLSHLLRSGMHFLYSDVDMFYHGNPFDELKPGFDVVGSTDSAFDQPPTPVTHTDKNNICTGLLYVAPTDSTMELMARWNTIMERTSRKLNQGAFNRALIDMGHLGKEPRINVEVLDKEAFPPGFMFFGSNRWQYVQEWQPKRMPVMVHNNFLQGTEFKIQRFKEHGLWHPQTELSNCPAV